MVSYKKVGVQHAHDTCARKIQTCVKLPTLSQLPSCGGSDESSFFFPFPPFFLGAMLGGYASETSKAYAPVALGPGAFPRRIPMYASTAAVRWG